MRQSLHNRGDCAPGMARCCRVFLRACILLPFFLRMGAVAHTGEASRLAEPLNVLILCSYHIGHIWTDQELQAQMQTLISTFPAVEIHVEFLDWKRFPQSGRIAEKWAYIGGKYRSIPLQVVIVNDNVALEGAIAMREHIFPGVPIVFAGINGYADIAPGLPQNVTGVAEEVDPAATLSLALALHRKTRTVVIITDQTESGIATRREVQRALLKIERNDIDFIFTDTLTMPELCAYLGTLPGKTLVYMTYFNWDRTGRFYGHEESVELVTAASVAPVYHSYDFALGRGIVGGRLLSGWAHGEAAANLAVRILQGEHADDIPPLLTSPCPALFDAEVMKRFGLRPGDLPPDAVLINVTETVWNRYKKQITALLGFIIAQMVIIGVLLASVRARRRAEARLRESEFRFRTIYDGVYEAILILDCHTGVIIDGNRQVSELFGSAAAELRGKELGTLGADRQPPDSPTIRERIGQIHAGAPQSFLWQVKNSRGEPFWVEATMQMATLGKDQHILVTLRDVSDRIQAEAQRAALERDLRQAEKMEAIGRLAGGIAHDFNNQLAGIMGYTQLLLTDPALPEDYREDLQRIESAARHSSHLTAHLLAFARKGAFVNETLDVHMQIRETVNLLTRSVDKRIEFVTRLEAASSLLCGDASQIHSALLNLGINGCDAMASGGALTYATTNVSFSRPEALSESFTLAPGAYVRVAVTDTGTGIAPEVVKHIFEPFFTTKETGKGTGLGLAAVFGTMKTHGGAVQVVSQPGQGSTFYLFFPVSLSGVQQEDNAMVPPAPVAGAHILVIEDELVVRQAAVALLTRLGYRSTVCSSADEALAFYRVQYQTIDAVLMDMVMPGHGGSEVFHCLRSINPSCRVVIFSGYALNDDIQALIDNGAIGFIQKPFNIVHLAQKLGGALERIDT